VLRQIGTVLNLAQQMDNPGATLIFYNRKHGNQVFRIKKKKNLPVERAVGL